MAPQRATYSASATQVARSRGHDFISTLMSPQLLDHSCSQRFVIDMPCWHLYDLSQNWHTLLTYVSDLGDHSQFNGRECIPRNRMDVFGLAILQLWAKEPYHISGYHPVATIPPCLPITVVFDPADVSTDQLIDIPYSMTRRLPGMAYFLIT